MNGVHLLRHTTYYIGRVGHRQLGLIPSTFQDYSYEAVWVVILRSYRVFPNFISVIFLKKKQEIPYH
jgi:hypothetical protein